MTQDKKTEDEIEIRKSLLRRISLLEFENQKLREENEALRAALELAAKNVTWYDKATDGSDVLYTYGYFVQKCQEVLAKYPRGGK